jgi:O-succinylhomoserine sulfhydrylase
LGDAKTTITHPSTTTHVRLTKEEKQQTHISENLVRISVGLENVEDIIDDLNP